MGAARVACPLTLGELRYDLHWEWRRGAPRAPSRRTPPSPPQLAPEAGGSLKGRLRVAMIYMGGLRTAMSDSSIIIFADS